LDNGSICGSGHSIKAAEAAAARAALEVMAPELAEQAVKLTDRAET
jgi:dsRNA-specific ribonuclease